MATRRIAHEPAYVLHRYDWSESSLILEVFTRHHGRTALVAKGAKRPTSNFRPVLLPLQPLQVVYTLSVDGDVGIHTLKGADWVGGHVMPVGDALLSGYYLNELLMRLLARDDPHPALFDAYAIAVQILASDQSELLQAALRAFELLLLREVGLLPALDAQTTTFDPLDAASRYSLVPETGLRPTLADDRTGLTGLQWHAISDALATHASFVDTLRACAPVAAPLRPQLRTLLHYHCGVATFRTRQMMVDLQNL